MNFEVSIGVRFRLRNLLVPSVYSKGKSRFLLVSILCLFFLTSSAQTNSWVMKGKVVNTKNEPVSGASIIIKGSEKGNSTDLDGNFIIEIVSVKDSIQVSAVNYKSQTIVTGTTREITVMLEEDTEKQKLDEIVVVGFGTQKKKDLVGSVTTVNIEDLKLPSSNLTQALGGRIAGIIAFQNSGAPGRDNADFFVRGITSFGVKPNPLILIDGIEMEQVDLARLRPDDIASFSVLKDATSTAVYGARGANGVILVTTKRGKVGKAVISVNAENSLSSPVKEVELADPITYMKMSNESRATRGNIQLLYSDEKIYETARPGANPYLFPAIDWKEMLFKKQANNQRYNINVSGGGGVARYFVSGSFTNDNGVLNVDKRNNFNTNINLKNYTLRSNVDIDIAKSTLLKVNLLGNFDDYTGPIYEGDYMYYLTMHSNPVLFPAYFPTDSSHQFAKHILFGNYDNGQYTNPYAEMVRGYKNYSRSLMLAQLELKQDLSSLTKGLSWRTMMMTNRKGFFDVSRYYNPYYYAVGGYDPMNGSYQLRAINEQTGTEYLNYAPGGKTLETQFYLESVLNYARTFKKHDVSGMLIYLMSQNLNANASTLQQSLPFRNLGLSGRFTYGYDSRYIGEFNFGYNGSERFAESKRFGFFPSAGVAWSVSNESFFEPLLNTVSNLKFRFTYGLIGFDKIGSDADRFFYLSEVNMSAGGRGASFGIGNSRYSLPGVFVNRYANENITWEISKQKNLGIELGLFNSIDLKVDLYAQKRTNILMNRAFVPHTLGLSAVNRANVGQASSKGIDASLNYKKNFSSDLSISAIGNFTFAKSRYDVYEEPEYKESYRSRVGQPIGQVYGYIAERLFIDDAEAANAPNQNSRDKVLGGDIKYLDINKDGQITSADMAPIGYPSSPEINYGFGTTLVFKSFDAGFFFNGLARRSFWIDVAATTPFVGETQILKDYADNYWSETNQNIYAIWPRLDQKINENNNRTSTWFMRDGAMLRLKSVELGYTLPKRIQNKVRATNFRVYFSGMNLLTFSKFSLWDTEMGGNGLGYPIQKTFNLGLNLSFN